MNMKNLAQIPIPSLAQHLSINHTINNKNKKTKNIIKIYLRLTDIFKGDTNPINTDTIHYFILKSESA